MVFAMATYILTYWSSNDFLLLILKTKSLFFNIRHGGIFLNKINNDYKNSRHGNCCENRIIINY